MNRLHIRCIKQLHRNHTINHTNRLSTSVAVANFERSPGHNLCGLKQRGFVVQPATTKSVRRKLPSTAMASASLKLIDIGANLLDSMYQGQYNDKEYHKPDLDTVLQRAWAAGVQKIMITAGNLEESKKALQLAQTDERLYCTVGCHPTRCNEFDQHPDGPDAYLQELNKVLQEGKAMGKVVAVGECGLDYDRLQFCEKHVQQKYFRLQFKLAESSGLPMFLHLRAAATDFLHIIQEHNAQFVGGVVHSFDGTADEALQVLAFSKLAIGINGCSLKTEANLQVVASIPVERLMIETDCPWCEIRNTHAASKYVKTKLEAKDRKKHDPACMVKSRNEPCNLRQILEVVAGCKGITGNEALQNLSEQLYSNTCSMFFSHR